MLRKKADLWVSLWKLQRITLHQQSSPFHTQTKGIYFTKPWIGTWILMRVFSQSFALYCNICLPLTYFSLFARFHSLFFLSLHLFLLLTSRCSQEREVQSRRQMLEEERRRREEAERRLQDEAAHRQRLVEEEVKMREKHFSQVSGTEGGDERGGGARRGGDILRGEDEKTKGWV